MGAFGEKIKKLRENKNMTIRILAQEMQMSASQISRYENGIHEPTLSVLNKYKEVFKVSLDYLCDDTKK